ncbi:MAG: AMP-binding protein [Thermodesulfobacteriota bacterium]|nr:AMP-binding protein [Thermodesulfobacteriota bacterium]
MIKDTFPHKFYEQVKKYGDKKVALREKEYGIWHEITWKEYGEQVKHFSLGLISLGLEKNDNVCIIGENCKEWVYADIGVQCAGGVTVGIYSIDYAEGVRYIVDNCQAKFIVAEDQEQTDKVLEFRDRQPHLLKCIVMDMKGLRHYNDPFIISFYDVVEMGRELDGKEPSLFQRRMDEVEPDDVNMMLYTSGTTGKPKGVMYTHDTIKHLLAGLTQVNPVYETDTVLSFLPLNHAIERLMSVIIPVHLGCTVNFAEDTSTVQENIREISPTFFLAVPRIYENLCSTIQIKMQDATWFKRLCYKIAMPIGYKICDFDQKEQKVPFYWKFLNFIAHIICFRALQDHLGFLRTRIMYTGGAAVAPEMNKFFYSIGIKLRELYGMTEIGLVTTHSGKAFRVGTAGKILPGVKHKITEEGELIVKTPAMFKGYYKNPEATEEAKGDGWMRTADLVRMDDEGYLHVLGRRQDVFISSDGKLIAPDELENKLKFSPLIMEAILIGEGREYLTCLIQIDYPNVGKWAMNNKIPYTTFKSLSTRPEVYDLIADEIRNVNKSLAYDRQIKKFLLLAKQLDHDEDELTATQKVRRAAIRTMYKAEIDEVYKSGREI